MEGDPGDTEDGGCCFRWGVARGSQVSPWVRLTHRHPLSLQDTVGLEDGRVQSSTCFPVSTAWATSSPDTGRGSPEIP